MMSGGQLLIVVIVAREGLIFCGGHGCFGEVKVRVIK
jgi:hypothetical protein